MAKPLPVMPVRENGVLTERTHSSKQDTSSQNNMATLRSMLATAEFWKEEDAASSEPPGKESSTEGSDTSTELDLLRCENADLRNLVAELQHRLEEGGGAGDAGWEERQREFESLLEEKSEVIRSLHQKIQELQSRPTGPALTPREDELIALSDDLERERCQLEQDRRQLDEERAQLKEDEKIMMQQMREMEVQMARERAELARQRNELQRLHTEVHHELELASRDAALRERLLPLQRRAQEMTQRGAPEPAPEQSAQHTPARETPGKEKGLLGRLFG